MANTIEQDVRVRLTFTDRNGEAVQRRLQEVDDAVRRINRRDATAMQRGLNAATDELGRTLQRVYGATNAMRRSLTQAFSETFVSNIRSGVTYSQSLSNAIHAVSQNMERAGIAGRAFAPLVSYSRQLNDAFRVGSGAEDLLRREWERVDAYNAQRRAARAAAAAQRELQQQQEASRRTQEAIANHPGFTQAINATSIGRTNAALAGYGSMLHGITEATRGAAIQQQLLNQAYRAGMGNTQFAQTYGSLISYGQMAQGVAVQNTQALTAWNNALAANAAAADQAANAEQRNAGANQRGARAANANNAVLAQLRRTLRQLTARYNELNNQLRRAEAEIARLTAASMRMSNTFGSAIRTFRNFTLVGYRVYVLFMRLGRAGKEWLDMSTAFAETNHLLMTTLIHSTGTLKATKVAMDDVTDATKDLVVQLSDTMDNKLDFGLLFENADIAQIIREANEELIKFTHVMMLDPTSVRKIYAAFLGMGDAAGITGARAVQMSQQMTQLAVNLSSLWDIDIEDAATKLRSALAGNTRAARQLGLDMGRTAANAWLVKNGIDADYNSLSLADRMTVQYALAMEGAAAAHDDLAKSALQPANMLRILGEQARKTARAFGQALFPVFTAFVPLIIVMVEALGKLASALSAFFGKKLGSLYTNSRNQWVSYADNVRFTARTVSDEAADMAEDFDNVGSSVGGAGKKINDFKKQLLGFDEINNLTETQDTGGGGGGGVGLGDSIIPDSLLADIAAMADTYGNVRVQVEAAAKEVEKFIKNSPIGAAIDSFRKMPAAMRPTFKGLLLGLTGATVQTINLLDALGRVPEKLRPLQRFIVANPEGALGQNLIGRLDTAARARTGQIAETSDTVTRMRQTELPLAYERAPLTVNPGMTAGERSLTAARLQPAVPAQIQMQGPARSVEVTTRALVESEETAARAAGGFGRLATVLTSTDSVLGRMFGTLVRVFGRLNPILDIVTVIIETLKNSPLLRKTLGTTLTTLVTILTYLGGIIDQIFKILSPVFAILGDVIALILTPANYLLQALAGLLAVIQGLLQPIADAMLGFTETFNSSFSEMPLTITGWLESLGGAPTVLDNVANSTEASMGRITTSVEDGTASSEENMQLMATSMKDAFDTSGVDILTIIGNLFMNIISAIVEWITTTDWAGHIQAIALFISTNAPKILHAVAMILGNIFNAIVNWIFGDLIPNFPTYLAKLWDLINTILGGWPNKIVQIGRDLIEGFKRGINEKWNQLTSWVSDKFGKLLGGVKKIFGIASPSKEFAAIGDFNMQGLMLGMNQELPAVLDTVNGISTQIKDTMANGLTDVSLLTANEMDNLSAAMNGTIASSSQVTLETQNNDVLGAMWQELGLLREQNSLLAQILGKDVSISLDGKQLAASINQASRIQGRPLVYA